MIGDRNEPVRDPRPKTELVALILPLTGTLFGRKVGSRPIPRWRRNPSGGRPSCETPSVCCLQARLLAVIGQCRGAGVVHAPEPARWLATRAMTGPSCVLRLQFMPQTPSTVQKRVRRRWTRLDIVCTLGVAPKGLDGGIEFLVGLVLLFAPGLATAVLSAVASEAGESPNAVRQWVAGYVENLADQVATHGVVFFDYAYYGNAVSAPLIVKDVLGPGASIEQSLAFNLIMFSIAAVPGYILAVIFMDRIGHRRLQLIGFPLMGLAFLLIGIIPGITDAILPFIILFGISFFFAEFGPNTTTFVLSAEVFPTAARATGHGISAGVAKLGAFIGVYLFPVIFAVVGISGALLFSAGMAVIGTFLTLLIPETARRSLEEISDEDRVSAAAGAPARSLKSGRLRKK